MHPQRTARCRTNGTRIAVRAKAISEVRPSDRLSRIRIRLEVLNDVLNNLCDALRGSEVQKGLDLAEVRDAPMHVFEAFFVGLVIGDTTNLGGALSHRLD